MNKSELQAMIRAEISAALNIVRNGQVRNAGKDTEDVETSFPGAPTITGRPRVEPFGLTSRAPDGSLSVSLRCGAHPGSIYVIGHRYASRPTVEVGEACLYSADGYQVIARVDRLSMRFGDTEQTMVLGEDAVAFLTDLISLLVAHTHAAPGAPPTNAASFTQLSEANLANDAILAKQGGGF